MRYDVRAKLCKARHLLSDATCQPKHAEPPHTHIRRESHTRSTMQGTWKEDSVGDMAAIAHRLSASPSAAPRNRKVRCVLLSHRNTTTAADHQASEGPSIWAAQKRDTASCSRCAPHRSLPCSLPYSPFCLTWSAWACRGGAFPDAAATVVSVPTVEDRSRSGMLVSPWIPLPPPLPLPRPGHGKVGPPCRAECARRMMAWRRSCSTDVSPRASHTRPYAGTRGKKFSVH